MNFSKHMTVFGLIALGGFILFWFMPQLGAAIFLPALGAYFGARKANTDGPKQPGPILWAPFLGLVSIALAIRFLVPEENFVTLEARPENIVLLWVYLGVLALAFLLFGYLAYLQRVGRTGNSK